MYSADGIPCHLVRASFVPTQPFKKRTTGRPYPTVFDEASLRLEYVHPESASVTTGWGPNVCIQSKHSLHREVMYGHGIHFVMIDPTLPASDQITEL